MNNLLSYLPSQGNRNSGQVISSVSIQYLFHFPSPPVLFFPQSYPPPFKVVISAHGCFCTPVDIDEESVQICWLKFGQVCSSQYLSKSTKITVILAYLVHHFDESYQNYPHFKNPDKFPNPIASDSKRASWVAVTWVRHVSLFVVGVRIDPYVQNLRRELGFKNQSLLHWISIVSIKFHPTTRYHRSTALCGYPPK